MELLIQRIGTTIPDTRTLKRGKKLKFQLISRGLRFGRCQQLSARTYEQL